MGVLPANPLASVPRPKPRRSIPKQWSIAALSDQGDLEFLAARIHGADDEDNRTRVRNGNAVMLVCRPYGEPGGEIVTVGTTDWVFGLAGDEHVRRVTQNVLDRFVT